MMEKCHFRSEWYHFLLVTCLFAFYFFPPSASLVRYNMAPGVGVLSEDDLSESANQWCHLRKFIHTINFRRCLPQNFRSYVCSGKCHSYTGADPNITTYGNGEMSPMLRACRCCQKLSVMTTRVVLKCRDENTGVYRRMQVKLQVPTRCICRHCSI